MSTPKNETHDELNDDSDSDYIVYPEWYFDLNPEYKIKEYSICSVCNGECSAPSQACGKCQRLLTMHSQPYLE